MKAFFFLSSLIILSSCTNKTVPPVIDGWQAAPVSAVYIVRANDTLYSIAWNFNLDVQKLANINHLSAPYSLKKGAKLYLNSPPSVQSTPKTKPFQKAPRSPLLVNQGTWLYPTKAKLKHRFHEPDHYQKGLDFGGQLGDPVYATQNGVVVYRGTGLTAYGKLIIIQHANNYLSAYGHLQEFKVKEQAQVKKGEIIGSIGQQNQAPTLHFEIRHFGNPIDPMPLLNSKN